MKGPIYDHEIRAKRKSDYNRAAKERATVPKPLLWLSANLRVFPAPVIVHIC